MSVNILVLYYSRYGNCEKMANLICRGIEAINDAQAICKTVPDIRAINDQEFKQLPDTGAPFATLEDLKNADGLIYGCPTHFGNMPAAMKAFWDQTTGIWLCGSLTNKPAAVFTSTSSLHGGQETTLMSMMLPLLHHGMLITGVPYTETDLQTTKTGGTPYGASHVAGPKSDQSISNEEKNICIALGSRLAKLAITIKQQA